MQKPQVSVVAAIGRHREIGDGKDLLWYIPEDLKRFKTLTIGHPVVMGRKTFDSIVAKLGKPLPGRPNIVITRDPAWRYEGTISATSIDEAVAKAAELDSEEIFIGGGGQIWSQTLPRVDKLYLTLIDDEKPANAFFPPYEELFTKETFREAHETPEGLQYTWVDLER